MWNLESSTKTVIVIWFSLLLLKHPIEVNRQNLTPNDVIYSSVWCHNSTFGKRCTFNNLCYNPKFNKFIFIIGKRSIFSGVETRDELKEISTTWLNHSHFYLKIAFVHNLIGEYELIKDRAIIMSRFKPDNIMHVIHDDLLPLYTTYKRICLGNVYRCSLETIIVFIDNYYSNFHRLYESFSHKKLLSLKKIESIICFTEVHVGVDSDSTFYQYGYEKPQGPLKPPVTGELFYEFSEYILKYLNIQRKLIVPRCTVIGRLINRKILNERFLVELIKDVHFRKTNQSISINILDINSHPIEDIIESITSSKLFVGMHGAGMILALFLPSGSNVLELFPFGIIKEYVSPLYSLSRIAGIYFGYLSWTNKNKENTLSHPEYPRLLGGFHSISAIEKERILSATSVPPVSCCHDPLYLHFMYQDTYVDSSIITILIQSFEFYKADSIDELMHRMWYIPSQVRNIGCKVNESHINISWKPPFNIKKHLNTFYKITLSSSDYNSTYVTKTPFIIIESAFKDNVISTWVQCIHDGIEGIDIFFSCCLKT